MPTPIRRTHRARIRVRALVLAAAVALAAPFLALAGAAPANAAPHTAASTGAAGFRPTHPELDWMGSTVLAHEGGDPSNHPVLPAVTQTRGMDVSGYQGSVAWATAYANGARFAYVKATEATDYTNPDFSQQYTGSYNAGLIRGSYHFAVPNASGGAAQADYFVAHGGGWSKDGKTLPGALDIEYNPYGATCYGLSQASMVSWISAFVNEYHAKTSRYPVIYTTTDWWTTCTGNSAAFAANVPLWLARYSSTVGTLPNGWGYQTIWQYADSGTFPGDQDYFNGALDRVQALANG